MVGSLCHIKDLMTETRQPATSFLGKFTVLNGAARELWLVFVLKLLNFAAYSVTNSTLKLWLSSEFGYTDQQAFHTVATWAISMTVVTLLVGSLTDAIGLRKAFFLGAVDCADVRAFPAGSRRGFGNAGAGCRHP
jgi:Na+/melibiose symporter-like transporter